MKNKVLKIILICFCIILIYSGRSEDKNIFIYNSSHIKNDKNKTLNINSSIKYYCSLIDEIDLKRSKINNFKYQNVNFIERFYKKIDKDDALFVIKNINSIDKIKNYFISKKLDNLPILKNDRINTIQYANYISNNLKGAYFCFQKVNYGNNINKEYFQIYNFTDEDIISFDTESEVLLIYLKSKKQSPFNADIFDNKAVKIKSVNDLNGTSVVISNNKYKEIFCYSNNSENFFYKLNLNEIQKTEYHVYANYNNNDFPTINMNGIIFKNDLYGNKLEKKNIFVQVRQGGRIIFKKSNVKINETGIFNFKFNMISNNDDIWVDFYHNDNLIKSGLVNNFYNEKYFLNDDEKIKVLSCKDNTIFKDCDVRFDIDEKYTEQIDSIYYSYESKDKNANEIFYNEKINDEIAIKLPENDGHYSIHFDIILKNGSRVKQDFKIEKIGILKSDIVIESVKYKGKAQSINYEIYNPFKNSSAYLIINDNAIIDFKNIKLDEGYNTIQVDFKQINKQYFKCIVFIKDFYTGYSIKYTKNINIESDLKINFTEKANEINIDLDDKLIDNFDLLYDYSPSTYNEFNSIQEILNSFNDFESPYDKIFKINYGGLSNLKIGKQIVLKNIQGISYDLNALLAKGNKIIYGNKFYFNKKKIDTEVVMPYKIDAKDNPDLKLNIKNNTNFRQDFTIIIKINNFNAFLLKNQIIKAKEEKIFILDIDIKKYLIDKRNNIEIIIMDGNNVIDYKKNEIILDDNYKYYDLNILGSIIGDREINSYIKVPNDSYDKFSLDIKISTNKNILYLDKSALIKNFNLKIFELELLKYLDDYFEVKNLDIKQSVDFILDYYIEDKGIKRSIYDESIDVKSTCLMLLCSTIIPEINNFNIANKIKLNLLKNFKKELLNDDFNIFVMAENGILFEEIDKNFINRINDTARSIYYYRYYNKYNLKYEVYKDDKTNKIQMNNLVLYYYQISNEYDLMSLNSQNVFKKILLKLFLLNNINDYVLVNPVEVKFISSKLGKFNIKLLNNDSVIKKYDYKYNGLISENNRLFDFSIAKNGTETLYYMVNLEYKKNPSPIIKSNLMEMSSNIYNEKQEILNKNKIELKIDSIYFININIKCENDVSDLYLETVKCNTLDIDYNNIICNGKKCKVINYNDRVFIKLDEMKKGNNIIKYKIIPKYNGRFIFYGNSIFDPTDLSNCLIEDSLFVDIK